MTAVAERNRTEDEPVVVFDHVSLAQWNRIGPVLCSLLETRWVEVRRALLIARGFGGGEDA